MTPNASATGLTLKPTAPGKFRFPDPPEREPDDMTSFDHLTFTGNVHHLAHHFGNHDTTLIAGERYISLIPREPSDRTRYPDLLIAFGVDPVAYRDTNGYFIPEQGKPPDFVMEIASPSTGEIDVSEKRDDYAALNIPEYWRFDETGQSHGARLGADRLAHGRYEPIPIEELPGGALQGYSAVLRLFIRWQDGQLLWIDPATGRHIKRFSDEAARADQAEAREEAEKERADQAEAAMLELQQELARIRRKD